MGAGANAGPKKQKLKELEAENARVQLELDRTRLLAEQRQQQADTQTMEFNTKVTGLMSDLTQSYKRRATLHEEKSELQEELNSMKNVEVEKKSLQDVLKCTQTELQQYRMQEERMQGELREMKKERHANNAANERALEELRSQSDITQRKLEQILKENEWKEAFLKDTLATKAKLESDRDHKVSELEKSIQEVEKLKAEEEHLQAEKEHLQAEKEHLQSEFDQYRYESSWKISVLEGKARKHWIERECSGCRMKKVVLWLDNSKLEGNADGQHRQPPV